MIHRCRACASFYPAAAARLGGCLRATRELVARDKNHPSVIMWSWANEPEANSHIATHGTQARIARPALHAMRRIGGRL